MHRFSKQSPREIKKRAGQPYADTRLAAFLEKRILELKSKKSQQQIATEAGFVQPNMLSMFKNRSNKLPLDRVAGLAKALDVSVDGRKSDANRRAVRQLSERGLPACAADLRAFFCHATQGAKWNGKVQLSACRSGY